MSNDSTLFFETVKQDRTQRHCAVVAITVASEGESVMAKVINSANARMVRNLALAAKKGSEASAARFCAAQDMRDALDSQEVKQSNTEPFEKISVICDRPDHAHYKVIRSVICAANGWDNKARDNEMKPYKGNALKLAEISNKYRNLQIDVNNTFDCMMAMAVLEKMTKVQPMIDSNNGKAALPAAWFVPFASASQKDQDELLGEFSPYKVMLQPTATARKAIVYYLAEGGVRDLRAALKKHAEEGGKGAKPDPRNFCGYEEVSISFAGLIVAHDKYVRAYREKHAPVPAQASAAAGNGAAGTVASPTAGNATQAAPQAAASAPASAAPGVTPADAAGVPGATRAPQTAEANGLSATLPQVVTFLRSQALRDNGKWKMSQTLVEEFAAMANAMWRHEQMAALLLSEREKVVKEQAADARSKQAAQQPAKKAG